jgi:hypothetical protein
MAATLTGDGQLTYVSFPIDKIEENADGDVIVYGKATDGIVDSDRQIVDPEWAAKAVQTWLQTGGNVRVQHNPMRDPAGKGLAAEADAQGGQWVKSLIVEPVAKDLVRKGVLRSYSVGIMHPQIVHDAQAERGRIVGGELGEISLVDRPANKNCTFQLVKAAASGGVEWVGKLSGAEMLTKDGAGDEEDSVTVEIPKSAKIKVTPADLAKMLAKRKMDPDVGGGVDRDKIPGEDFAGRDRSFPIVTPADVDDAAKSIGRAGDDNYSSDELKANIIRIAKRKGEAFIAQLPDAWKKELGISKGIGVDEDTFEDELLKLFDADEDFSVKGHKPAPKDDGGSDEDEGDSDGSEMHGVGLNEDDSDSGDDDPDDPDDADKYASSSLHKGDGQQAYHRGADETAECPSCHKYNAPDAKFCDQCGARLPESAFSRSSAVKGLFPGAAAPFKKKTKCPSCKAKGKAGRSECTKCGAKMAVPDVDKDTAEKSAGRTKPTPGDGVVGAHTEPVPEHREPDGPAIEAFEADAKLPTDPDAAVKTAHKHASLGVTGDLGVLHDLLCPAYSHKSVSEAHPYATLANIDTTTWQTKAMEAATGAPLQEAMAATDRWHYANLLKGLDADTAEELRYELHKAFQDANPGPGTFPKPSEVKPGMFQRPILTAGHARPSFQAAEPNTSPMAAGQIMASQFTRDYLSAGRADESPANKGADLAVAPPRATGTPSRVFYTNQMRDNARQAMVAMHDHIAQTYPDICPMGATVGKPEIATSDAPEVRPAVGKSVKIENPDVQDEVRDMLTKAAVRDPDVQAIFKAMMPDLVKSAVAEATADLSAKLEATEKELKKQRKASAELQKAVNEMADLPDPRTAPFKAVAQPGALKSFGAGTAPTTASIAERSQLAVIELLRHDYETSTNPVEREAALKSLRMHLGI